MNPYKLAWMQECTAEFDVSQPNKIQAKASSPTVMKHIEEAIVDHAKSAIVVTGLAYMATNQMSNPLIRGTVGAIGKVGVRAIPIIGVAYTAYSIYDWLSD
jgi:hypothetical protein